MTEPKKRGAPIKPPEQKTIPRSIRATESQWLKYDQIGGNKAFRSWIDRAKVKAP
jgi:hypothetical protein